MLENVSNIKIAGINACLPNNCIKIEDLIQNADKDLAFKIQRTALLAGLEERYIAHKETNFSDLAITAGKDLLNKLHWEESSIDAIFIITHTPDFLMPTTGYFIHKALNLSANCLVLDINASCSGLIQGLCLASKHISNKNRRILVFAGDIYSKFIRPSDIGNAILFGDGVGLIALEYSENEEDTFSFNLTSYPDSELALVAYGSGYKESKEEKGLHMQGDKIATFSQTKTVENIMQLLEAQKLSLEDIEVFFLHQANMALLQLLEKKLNINPLLVPKSIASYGNCSSANIALLCTKYFSENTEKVFNKALFCGFGGGLAVASLIAPISGNKVFKPLFLEF